MNEKKRIEYIDAIRGFGILLMLMGHIGFGRKFDYYIHAFHMPLFFFLSGYFYSEASINKTWKDYVERKFKTLILPYGVFGIINYLVWIMLQLRAGNKFGLFNPLLRLISFNHEGLPIAGALWFLTSLFFMDIIYFALNKYSKSMLSLSISVASIALIGCLWTKLIPWRMPYTIDAALVGMGLCHIARLIRKYLPILYNVPNFGSIIFFFIASTMLIFVNGYVNMRTGKYANIPLFWIIAVANILAIWNVIRFIYEKWGNNFKHIYSWLEDIGKYSIIYVCINQLDIWAIGVFQKRIEIYFPIEHTLAYQFYTLAILLLVLFIETRIIIETKLRVLIGK